MNRKVTFEYFTIHKILHYRCGVIHSNRRVILSELYITILRQIYHLMQSFPLISLH